MLDQISGEQLARTHCVGCHLFPEPSLLNRHIWEEIMMPRMAYYFGIYRDTTREALFEGGRARLFVERMNVFPEKQTLDTAIYNKITRYYLDEAPAELPAPPKKNIKTGLKHFKLVKPGFRSNNPTTNLVKVTENDGIYFSDMASSRLSIVDPTTLKVVRSARTPEGAVWINEYERNIYATVIGTFNPSDHDHGFLMQLPGPGGGSAKKIIQNLQRPVHADFGDLDGDGLTDIVISEFGKHTGSLSWWRQDEQGNYRKRVLRNKPGATKAYIRDLNGNGKQDIIGLLSQGDEGIFAYYNQGDGNFKEETILRFPPSYGASYFNLFDFNNDGFDDIILAVGDNADYDPIIKHYHGIYIYYNDGENRFTEGFFYQLNGAYGAIPHDFDKDGDIDIAAISFFPDYENSPEESFVYLENKGNMQFEASTFAESPDGRWIVMDAADIDGDGDMDLILGNMLFGTDYTEYFNRWVENGLPFVILENTIR
ncbi:MAG: VCBS repeat-containing protein [Cyclobacteriaceae bacterium]|nr:VCBS repeat-containing protein [Cyclobacteriaceae bacterium]